MRQIKSLRRENIIKLKGIYYNDTNQKLVQNNFIIKTKLNHKLFRLITY